jgi:RND family efflux transporter MFP subunit
MTDAGDAPGSVLETFSLMVTASDIIGSVLSVSPLTHPVLAPGEKYWLIASVPGAAIPGDWVSWNKSNEPSGRLHAYRQDGRASNYIEGHAMPDRFSRSLLLAACSAVLLVQTTACGEPEPAPELPPRTIRWMRVAASVPAETRVISGIVTAVDDTRLAFEVGGTVAEVDARLGDQVQRGDRLARLDPEPFELRVRDAEASLADAIARQQRAQAEFGRTTELFEADVASRQELDRDRAARDSTASRVEAARAQLALAKRDLRRSVLLAPFTGSISVREIEPAMEVASGQTAFEMDSEESGLRVEVQMPETLITRVAQGDSVKVTLPSIEGPGSAGDGLEAIVTEVGTRAGAGNAFPVRADFSQAPPGLRPGMTAEVAFALPPIEADALGFDGVMIPFAAVRAGQDETFSVFVFDKATSTLKRTPIQSGGVRDNDVAVLSGLEEGAIIATAGVSFLRDGQTVRLADERLVGTPR